MTNMLILVFDVRNSKVLWVILVLYVFDTGSSSQTYHNLSNIRRRFTWRKWTCSYIHFRVWLLLCNIKNRLVCSGWYKMCIQTNMPLKVINIVNTAVTESNRMTNMNNSDSLHLLIYILFEESLIINYEIIKFRSMHYLPVTCTFQH